MEVIDMYPYILMIFVVIFYSGNILGGKGINELPPLTITFFRLFIAIIVLYPFGFRSAWQNRSTFLTHKKPLIIMGVTGILLFNTFMYPYILMIFVVIFYSGNILVGKGINELPPLTITFFRLFIAIIVLYPFGFRSAWQNRSTFLTHKKPFIIMGVTGILLFNTFI